MEYYVSIKGNDSNKGTISEPWRTIRHSMSTASPVKKGDIVYVERGDYGKEYIEFTKPGIKLIGYCPKTSGDKIVSWESGLSEESLITLSKLNNNISKSAIPVPIIDCQNPADGRAVFYFPNQTDIEVYNFVIMNTSYGVSTGESQNLLLNNINAINLGDPTDNYSGRGILLGSPGTRKSNNNMLNNCKVFNAGAEGIVISGDNNLVRNCYVGCNVGLSNINIATDYYIQIAGDQNTIQDCKTERIGKLAHSGHGITAYMNSRGNRIQNCVSINMMGEAFCARHSGASFNEFISCNAIGGNAFVVRDGANDNVFYSCTAKDTYSGFRLFDTSEDGGAINAGNGNRFTNCIIQNSVIGIFYDEYGVDSKAIGNSFEYCTLSNVDTVIYGGRNAEDSFTNGEIRGYKQLYSLKPNVTSSIVISSSIIDAGGTDVTQTDNTDDVVTTTGSEDQTNTTPYNPPYLLLMINLSEIMGNSNYEAKAEKLNLQGYKPCSNIITANDGKLYQQWCLKELL